MPALRSWRQPRCRCRTKAWQFTTSPWLDFWLFTVLTTCARKFKHPLKKFTDCVQTPHWRLCRLRLVDGFFLLGEEFNPPVEFALYALAIAFHFLAIDHALREAHPKSYDRVGRYILAGMCIVAWAMSQVMTLPDLLLALLVAFISGAIVVNSSISELPREKDGRF